MYKIDHEGGNIHHTRLRLGLSHLRAHLFRNNLIPDPVCQFCNLEVETISHYLLKYPTYTVHRVRYFMDLNNILEPPYIAGLNDDKIVSLFLYGDENLNYNVNEQLFQHNLIDNPTCQFCGLESETTSHYILKCPTYTVHRVRFLMGLTNLLDAAYIAGLNDDKIVQLFLHGDPELSYETNVNIISLAQSFIVHIPIV